MTKKERNEQPKFVYVVIFSNLFVKVESLDLVTLAQAWNNDNIKKISLIRGAILHLRSEKSEIISILRSLSANFLGQDIVVWFLTATWLYTVRSMYLFFMTSGYPYSSLLQLWNLYLPLKIKYFLWLVLHCKILIRNNLFKRG
jgi:zinc-binding in reverse transcriptase